MTERLTVEGDDPGPWTSVTDALAAGRSFTEDLDAALAVVRSGLDFDPAEEALASIEAELDRARETVTELAAREWRGIAQEVRDQLRAELAELRQHTAAVEEYVADLRAVTEWTAPGLAPVGLGLEVVSDAHDAADALAEDVERLRGRALAADLTVEDTEDAHAAGSFLPGAVLERKSLADRLRDVHRWRTNLRREARRRRALALQDDRPPGRECSRPRRPVHRCRPRHFTRSGSADDPAPSRWQGALVGTPTSPGRDDRESERAPTDP